MPTDWATTVTAVTSGMGDIVTTISGSPVELSPLVTAVTAVVQSVGINTPPN